MADRPIIFSGPMVRALLDGRKTQTRRLASSPLRRVEAGDRLWVKEALCCGGIFTDVVEVRYRAHERHGYTVMVEQIPVGLASAPEKLPTWPKWRPSIHMPRWASRLTLLVVDIRTERLRSIGERDAKAEGLERSYAGGLLPTYRGADGLDWRIYPDDAYGDLWDSLHKEPGQRWRDDPVVIALTFTVERHNIDRIAA